jgi:hypothetical protein
MIAMVARIELDGLVQQQRQVVDQPIWQTRLDANSRAVLVITASHLAASTGAVAGRRHRRDRGGNLFFGLHCCQAALRYDDLLDVLRATGG